MSVLRFAIAILLLTTSLRGADFKPPQPHTPAKTVRPGAAPARSDAQIEADIRARFARSKINADKFQVRVQGGIATIEGRTDVIQHKGTATRLAKSGGAAAVKNNIQISEDAKKRAAKNLQEGRRRVQVKRGDVRSQSR